MLLKLFINQCKSEFARC